jgi:Fur family transcriptional regulator, iron response regulator
MISGLNNIVPLLLRAGLRPTRHRVALARLLFDRDTTRHVTAEQLFAEAKAAHISLSLATVYNVLNQFLLAGLLREIRLMPGPIQYDTNILPHHHIVACAGGQVICVNADEVGFSRLPTLPEGEMIERIEVVIWTRKISASTS